MKKLLSFLFLFVFFLRNDSFAQDTAVARLKLLKYTGSTLKSEDLWDEAKLKLQSQDYKSALKKINEALKLAPNAFAYGITKAEILFKTEEYKDCIDLTKDILKQLDYCEKEIFVDLSEFSKNRIKNDFYNTYYFQGMSYIALQGRNVGGRSMLRGLVSSGDNSEGAVEAFQNMNRYNPKDFPLPYVMTGYAFAYNYAVKQKGKDKSSACEFYQKAKERLVNEKEAQQQYVVQQYLAQIQSLAGCR